MERPLWRKLTASSLLAASSSPKRFMNGKSALKRYSPSLVIGDIQIKSQWNTTASLLESLKLDRLNVTSAGKDVEELKLSYSAEGNVK